MKSETIRRLAARHFKCGKNKVWLDQNESLTFKSITNYEKVKEAIQTNLIIQKPNTLKSRYHTRKRQAEVEKGRHRGLGKIRGKKTALNPPKKIWIDKIRQMRGELAHLRDDGYLSKKEHRIYYMQAKGNTFKSVSIMKEVIDKRKQEEKRMRDLTEQAAALGA